jgi:hypothetical protein
MLRIIKENCPFCNHNAIATTDDLEFCSKYCIKCWKYIYLFGSPIYATTNISYIRPNNNVCDIHKKIYLKKTN